jgi:hypothetical protein
VAAGRGGQDALAAEWSVTKPIDAPARFWGVLARLTQPFVERRPSVAYQLLCVKELDRPGIESTRS